LKTIKKEKENQELKLDQISQSLREVQKFFVWKDKRDKEIQHIEEMLKPWEAEYLAPYIYRKSQKYGLEPKLIVALIAWESAFTFDPKIKSPVGAVGLMQVMPSTASKLLGRKITPKELENISLNLELGCYYLSILFSRFSDLKAVLASYNGGPRRGVSLLKGKWIPKETKTYVKNVCKLYLTI